MPALGGGQGPRAGGCEMVCAGRVLHSDSPCYPPSPLLALILATTTKAHCSLPAPGALPPLTPCWPLQVVELLLDRGALIDATDQDGWTPLHQAAYSGRLPTCRVLLQRGASLLALTNDHSTALHLAARQNQLSVAEMLLEAGARVDMATQREWGGRERRCGAAWQGGGLEGGVVVYEAAVTGQLTPFAARKHSQTGAPQWTRR